jgi:pimeloyl-ACP methyl ester carboxylesterase
LKQIKTSPILVIGVTNDPATPYKWAEDLVKVFTNAKLLTLNGEGHTGHNQGNKCVDSVVDSYFLTGKIGPEPLICAKSGT